MDVTTDSPPLGTNTISDAEIAQRKLKSLSISSKFKTFGHVNFEGLPVEMVHAIVDTLPVAEVLLFYLSGGILRTAVTSHPAYADVLAEDVRIPLMLLYDMMSLTASTENEGMKNLSDVLADLQLTRQNIPERLEDALTVQGRTLKGPDGKRIERFPTNPWARYRVDYRVCRRYVNLALYNYKADAVQMVADMMEMQRKLVRTYPGMVTNFKDPGEEPRRPRHIDTYCHALFGKRVLRTAKLMAGHPQPRFVPYRRYHRLLQDVQKKFSSHFDQLSPECVRTIQFACKQAIWFPNDPLRHEEGLEVCRMALKICRSVSELQSLSGPLGEFARQRGKYALQVKDW